MPAESTLLVRTSGPADIERVVEHLRRIEPRQIDDRTAPLVTIDVTYDGPDLADVAQACALTADRAVQLHTAAEFVVAFCGSRARIRLPGRTAGRSWRCRAGTPCGLRYQQVRSRLLPTTQLSTRIARREAGTCSARTGTTLFDPDAARPALLTPGTRVRFRAMRRQPRPANW